jgi:dimethylhistidine N-methyltransferase
MIHQENPHPLPCLSATTALNPTFAFDVLAGLCKSPKSLPSKYFYDDRGSRIFEQIMRLPEYYPTRCEAQIFERYKDFLLEICREAYYHIIDLGAGDATKTRILLDYFYQNGLPFEYLPADISGYSLRELEKELKNNYPDLPVQAITGDYFSSLGWIKQQVQGQKLLLFLGSNIGNFSQDECQMFLLQLWQSLEEGDRLLIGFDLKKEGSIVHRAYNDSQGVTAAFNKNLLYRINRELGGNFDPDAFDFHATYDPDSGFVRSYLVSKEQQSVYIEKLNRRFEFQAWESIHTENSRKFSLVEIEEMASLAGFVVEDYLFDDKRFFTDAVLRVTGKVR